MDANRKSMDANRKSIESQPKVIINRESFALLPCCNVAFFVLLAYSLRKSKISPFLSRFFIFLQENIENIGNKDHPDHLAHLDNLDHLDHLENLENPDHLSPLTPKPIKKTILMPFPQHSSIPTQSAVKIESVLRKQTNWKRLWFYQKTVVLYQLTYVFTRRFLPAYGDRTVDQMVQLHVLGSRTLWKARLTE